MDKQLAKTAGKVAKTVIEHTPEPIKDKVKEVVADKAKEKIVENVQDKAHHLTENLESAKEKFADKVEGNAEKAKENAFGAAAMVHALRARYKRTSTDTLGPQW